MEAQKVLVYCQHAPRSDLHNAYLPRALSLFTKEDLLTASTVCYYKQMLANIIKKVRQWAFHAQLEWPERNKTLDVPDKPKWFVRLPYDIAYFYNHDAASTFAGQNNSIVEKETCTTTAIEPATMLWIIEQRKKGVNTGQLANSIALSHAESFDDMLAWFEWEKSPNAPAAYELLKKAYALGRTDATCVVAKWIKQHPTHWFSTHALQAPSSVSNGNTNCLFGYLIQKPILMQWLMNQQLHLKTQMLEPLRWKELEAALNATSPMCGRRPAGLATWPATAHRAFGKDINLLDYEWTDVNLLPLAKSFGHDPAAQSYLLYANELVFRNLIIRNVLPGIAPEVVAFYNRMQERVHQSQMRSKSDVSNTHWTDDRQEYDPAVYDHKLVTALVLGVELLEPRSQDFYYHAKAVFNGPNEGHELVYEDLNTTIFQ